MATSRGGRFPTLAAQISALKYQPKYAALANAIGEATQAYKQTVQQGNATAALTTRAAQQALPAIQAAYGAADAAHARLVSPDLAAQPSSAVNDTFKAGMQSEVQQQLSNLLSARAGAVAQNASVAPAAREGAQFNQVAARQTLASELNKLLGQRSQIAGEQGADTAVTAEKLIHDAEGNQTSAANAALSAQTSRENAMENNAQQERSSERSAQSQRERAQRTAEGKAPLNVKEAQAKFSGIKAAALHIVAEGHSRQDAIAALQEARPSISTKTKSGSTVHLPERPAYTPDVIMSAALDEAEYGHVTPATLKRLQQAHYDPRALGLNTHQPSVTHPDPALEQSRARGIGRRRG